MTIIITGSSDGIGKSAAGTLARMGHTVYGISRSPTGVPGVHSLIADVGEPSSLGAAAEQILAEEPCIDLLLCCAGVSLASPAAFTESADARHVHDVNFWGCVESCSLFLPALRRNGGGKIMLVSSMAGQIPIPYLGFYCSAKAALDAYAQTLRMELRPFGISVSVLSPGGVRTQLTAKRKKYSEYSSASTGTQFSAPGLHHMTRSIGREEQSGMPIRQVTAAILRNICKKYPPAVIPVGGWYHLFALLQRLSPRRLLLRVVAMKYARL